MLVDDPAGHGHTTSNPAAGLVEPDQQPEVPEGDDRAAEGQQPPAWRPTALKHHHQVGGRGPEKQNNASCPEDEDQARGQCCCKMSPCHGLSSCLLRWRSSVDTDPTELGRASVRERVCQSV